LAKKNPHTQIVVDHVGLNQPFEPPVPPEPFANLADVIALARYDNVAIKISGACTLSHQPFPYEDIWEPLSQIFEAFGFDRCLWGTDWTRAVELLTYEQGVEAFRLTDQLSDSERDMLMGGSVAGIYDWVPGI
jgi:predicted TIM-barrel fold metal-dependent hydrolase